MDKKNLEEFVNKVEENANEILEDTLLDEDSKEESRDIDYSDIVKNDTKAKMSKVPWLTAIFLILVIALASVAAFFKSNPQAIFTMAIDKFFKGITENISDTNYEVLKGKIKANLELEGYEELDKLNGVSFDIDYSLDNVNNLLYSKVATKYDNKDLIKFDVYNDNKNVYVYSKEIFDKYVKLNDIKMIKPISSKNKKIILNGLNQAFDKVVTNEKINTSKTTLDINNQSIKVYESRLIVDKNNKERVAETFINTLKSNDEFISSIAISTQKTDSEVKKKLDEYKAVLKQEFKENEKLEIKLYLNRKNNKFIKGVIDGKKNLISVKKEDDTYLFELADKKAGEKLSGSITIKKEKEKYNLSLYIKKTESDKEVSKLKTDIKVKTKKAQTFKRIDISQAIDQEDITEEEKQEMLNKLLTNQLNQYIK